MRHASPPATDDVAKTSDAPLTVAAVVERLGVSKSTVYNLIASGRLGAHCNGAGKVRPRGYRVRESQITEYLHSSLTSPTPVA